MPMCSEWIKCSFEPGMLPSEYAVEVETVNAGKVSLFASADKVWTGHSLLRVEKLQDDDGNGVLVRLPAQPFEVACQNVRVGEVLTVAECASKGIQERDAVD